MAPVLLPANIMRSRRAQDLLVHTLREQKIGLAVVTEPYNIPDLPDWVGSRCSSVTITWTWTPASPPATVIETGEGCVAVQWADIAVVGCYVSPNTDLASYETYLDGLEACVRRCMPRPVIVLGDFNAHATAWGSPRTNRRGEVLMDWAAGLDLRLVNRGRQNTFVGPRGVSIIDLTWATPSDLRRLSGWRVATEVATLSDHLYITMERWAAKRLDDSLLEAAAQVAAWPETPAGPVGDIEGEMAWFNRAIMACV
ncbi:uncharacterized protein LOC143187674 [Calliopsis andreniformis]|uniref:uncharacterized protein LOC143187674 n=1 Tax=Calliopsis andreniformis TaxID=337506 RepID=UPI003FCDDD3C